MQESSRIRRLPPYLFAQIEERIAEAVKSGRDVISLGIGDPDLPTPPRAVEALAEAAILPGNHRYPSSAGLLEFRQAVADWYRTRFGVELDPKTEITTLIGSKEGIANLPLCFVENGDISLVPDPGYPVYTSGTLLAGGEVYNLPLLEENSFLPDFAAVPAEVLRRTKLLWLNYPNNPTGAVAGREFFERAVAWAREHQILICHDAAYSEIAFDGFRPPSILEVDGAKDVAIAALSEPVASDLIAVYQQRRDLVVEQLSALGWNVAPPKAGIYIWAPVPSGYSSLEFAEHVFEQTNVVITPGVGYGRHGDGYFRISICLPAERIAAAFQRWETQGIRFA